MIRSKPHELMAHFYCPNCGHTETLYANAKNCKCPICNKKLVKGAVINKHLPYPDVITKS
jgi:ribosomal protein S27E